MSPDLDALLCRRYPALLGERRWPMSVTAMCWGFDCDDGWFLIIDQLCVALQAAVAAKTMPQPVAVQVKEKFGELRFYLRSTSAEAERLVGQAAERSRVTCEACGEPGVLRIDRYRWLGTRCDRHAEPGSVIASQEVDEP